LFYSWVRALVGFAIRLFYRVRVSRSAPEPEGPLIYVGNHPNSLIDPALLFVISRRPVTFLAKAPLFRVPGLAQVLKGLGALPVYRKQDDPGLMAKNEATFEVAVEALVAGKALTVFPEGRSHSEPALGELKTGAARIALRAASRGAAVKIVPVGLTYAEKSRFRSEVAIEVGPVLEIQPPLSSTPDGDREWVRKTTEEIAAALERVTLNLESWEDLPLIAIAEELYALRVGEKSANPERLRGFARGLRLFRSEQPKRFEEIRAQLMAFRHRLQLSRASPRDLRLRYHRAAVYAFALRNLAVLVIGLPLAALGIVIFAVPFSIPRWLTRALDLEEDVRATSKFLASLIVAPLWMGLVSGLVWKWLGWKWGLLALLLLLPLALFTRYFVERHAEVLRDAKVFFALANRAKLKARLLIEGERLSAQVQSIATELRPRVVL